MAREAAGANGARAFPAPSFTEGQCFAELGREIAPREGGDACSKRASLRANGSGECPPDDRLREAIHLTSERRWIASSLSLLAMTRAGYNAANTALPISAVPFLPPNSIGLIPCA